MIERLIPEFDVLYENFRLGVMDRLGLSYERCEELNPRIIYVSATGYGPDGPHAAKPGQDVLIDARTGWGQLNSVDGRPVPVASAVADTLGAMNGAFGTACAIVHAVRTGEGQRVRTSLYESAIAGMAEWGFHFLNAPAGEPQRPRPEHASPYTPPPYGFYATKDGYIALSSGRQIGTLSRIPLSGVCLWCARASTDAGASPQHQCHASLSRATPVTDRGGAPRVGGVLENRHVAFSRTSDRLRLSTGAEIGRTDHDMTEPVMQLLKQADRRSAAVVAIVALAVLGE